MNKYQLKNHLETLGEEILNNHKEIRENYDMGLITFSEYNAQIMSYCINYTRNSDKAVEDCMTEEGCTKDYLSGYLSNFSITI